MFVVGVLPVDMQPHARVEAETHIFIHSNEPLLTRMRLLRWFEDEFFPYEEMPAPDVVLIRAGHLPKPILVTVLPKETNG